MSREELSPRLWKHDDRKALIVGANQSGETLARHLLSQMDVPTRQAYTVALVAPEERAAAAGFTVSARALAQACAPAIAGATMAVAATPAPFVLAGGLKIVYDLCLFMRFRGVPLDAARPPRG
jgi:hypothetical protein